MWWYIFKYYFRSYIWWSTRRKCRIKCRAIIINQIFMSESRVNCEWIILSYTDNERRYRLRKGIEHRRSNFEVFIIYIYYLLIVKCWTYLLFKKQIKDLTYIIIFLILINLNSAIIRIFFLCFTELCRTTPLLRTVSVSQFFSILFKIIIVNLNIQIADIKLYRILHFCKSFSDFFHNRLIASKKLVVAYEI